MSHPIIEITTAEAFIDDVFSKVSDNKEFKKKILEEYRFSLAKLFNDIKNMTFQNDWEFHSFKYTDSKLYYEDIGMLEWSKTIISQDDSDRVKLDGIRTLFKMFELSLKSIVYPLGYKVINDIGKKLTKIIADHTIIAPHTVEESVLSKDLQDYLFVSVEKYGETIHNLAKKISDYLQTLEGIDGFSSKEWDVERSIIDQIVLEKRTDKSNNLLDFLHSYLGVFVILMERNCAELEKKVNKINFN